MARSYEALQRLVQNQIAVAQVNAATRSSKASELQAQTSEKMAKIQSITGPLNALSGLVDAGMGVVKGIDDLSTSKAARSAMASKVEIAEAQEEDRAKLAPWEILKAQQEGLAPFVTSAGQNPEARAASRMGRYLVSPEQSRMLRGVIFQHPDFAETLEAKFNELPNKDSFAPKEKQQWLDDHVWEHYDEIKDDLSEAIREQMGEGKAKPVLPPGLQEKEGGKLTTGGRRKAALSYLQQAGYNFPGIVDPNRQGLILSQSMLKSDKGFEEYPRATLEQLRSNRSITFANRVADSGPGPQLANYNAHQYWNQIVSESPVASIGRQNARLLFPQGQTQLQGYNLRYGGNFANRKRHKDTIEEFIQRTLPGYQSHVDQLIKSPKGMGAAISDSRDLEAIVGLAQGYAFLGAGEGSSRSLGIVTEWMNHQGDTSEEAAAKYQWAATEVSKLLQATEGEEIDPRNDNIAWRLMEGAGTSREELLVVSEILQDLSANSTKITPVDEDGNPIGKVMIGATSFSGKRRDLLLRVEEDKQLEAAAIEAGAALTINDNWYDPKLRVSKGSLEMDKSVGKSSWPPSGIANGFVNNGASEGQYKVWLVQTEQGKKRYSTDTGGMAPKGMKGSDQRVAGVDFADWQFGEGNRNWMIRDEEASTGITYKTKRKPGGGVERVPIYARGYKTMFAPTRHEYASYAKEMEKEGAKSWEIPDLHGHSAAKGYGEKLFNYYTGGEHIYRDKAPQNVANFLNSNDEFKKISIGFAIDTKKLSKGHYKFLQKALPAKERKTMIFGKPLDPGAAKMYWPVEYEDVKFTGTLADVANYPELFIGPEAIFPVKLPVSIWKSLVYTRSAASQRSTGYKGSIPKRKPRRP